MEPVLSPKSNAIFEKSYIEAFLYEHGIDPLTEEPLKPNELISLNVPKIQSIDLLEKSQNEYIFFKDLNQEIYSLVYQAMHQRELIKDAQKKLNRALYQVDALYLLARKMDKQVRAARVRLAENGEAIFKSEKHIGVQTNESLREWHFNKISNVGNKTKGKPKAKGKGATKPQFKRKTK